MTNTDWLILSLLLGFIGVVAVVFRGRRWSGALGWALVAGTFMISVLNSRRTVSLISSSIIVIVAVCGIVLVAYDYVRFERPKRRGRREQPRSLLDGPPPIRHTRRRLWWRNANRHRQPEE